MQEDTTIALQDIESVVCKMANWKAAGLDLGQCFQF